jgi:hypothetical protein
MSAVIALVKAMDAIKLVDAVSREDKISVSNWILGKCPKDLPVELAARITSAESTLKAKYERQADMTHMQRLKYLAAVAANPPAPPKPKDTPTHGNTAETDFGKAEIKEMRAADRALDWSQGARRRVEALESFRNSLGKAPTPWWAVHGHNSPEDYERAKAREKACNKTAAVLGTPVVVEREPDRPWEAGEDTSGMTIGDALAQDLDDAEQVLAEDRYERAGTA